jgi:hypothetical protein
MQSTANLADSLTLSSKIKRFPVRGAFGLIGSALSVLLSWLTLYFLNGHKVQQQHGPDGRVTRNFRVMVVSSKSPACYYC